MSKSNSENIPKGISNVFQPTISLLHHHLFLLLTIYVKKTILNYIFMYGDESFGY